MLRRKRMVTGLVVFMVLGLNLSAVSEEVYEAWVARYEHNVGSHDYAVSLVTDKSGNVYITGHTYADFITGFDMLTVKYSPIGDMFWARDYNGEENWNDLSVSVQVDTAGYVYVAGSSYGLNGYYDYLLIKYNSVGDSIWTRRFDEVGDEWVRAMQLNESGDIYLTGGHADFLTVKFSTDGELLWSHRYGGSGNDYDDARAMVIDDSGYLYITGGIKEAGPIPYHICTIKYSPQGDTIWVRKFGGSDTGPQWGNALANSNDNKIYLVGRYFSETGLGDYFDYVTIKYDSNGEIIWTRQFDSPASISDEVSDVALDNDQIYVTGNTGTIAYTLSGDTSWLNYSKGTQILASNSLVYVLNPDAIYPITAYAKSGSLAWRKQYLNQGDGSFQATSMKSDSSGNLFVTGSGWIGTSGINIDYLTIKYSPCLPTSPKSGDANSDDSLSLSDVISTVNYIFGRGEPRRYPPCDANLYDCWVYNRFCRYDWNGDQKITLGDCIRAINFIFNKPGGPWNPAPSLGCCPFQQSD